MKSWAFLILCFSLCCLVICEGRKPNKQLACFSGYYQLLSWLSLSNMRDCLVNLKAGLCATHSHLTLWLCCYTEHFWHKGTLQAVWLHLDRREWTLSRAKYALWCQLLIKTLKILHSSASSVGPLPLAIVTEVNTC